MSMLAGIASALFSGGRLAKGANAAEEALTGGLKSLVGNFGTRKATSGHIAPVGTTGLDSAMRGSTPPAPGHVPEAQTTGSQAQALVTQTAQEIAQGVATQSANQASKMLVSKVFGNPAVFDAKQRGEAQKAYLDTAHPGTNVWDQLGAPATPTGSAVADTASADFAKQALLQKQQLDNQTKIAGINGAISRANTIDQTRSAHAQIEGQIAERDANIASIQARTDLTQAEKASVYQRMGLTDAQIAMLNAQTGHEYIKAASTAANTASTLNDIKNENISDRDEMTLAHEHKKEQIKLQGRSGGIRGPMSGKPKDDEHFERFKTRPKTPSGSKKKKSTGFKDGGKVGLDFIENLSEAF